MIWKVPYLYETRIYQPNSPLKILHFPRQKSLLTSIIFINTSLSLLYVQNEANNVNAFKQRVQTYNCRQIFVRLSRTTLQPSRPRKTNCRWSTSIFLHNVGAGSPLSSILNQHSITRLKSLEIFKILWPQTRKKLRRSIHFLTQYGTSIEIGSSFDFARSGFFLLKIGNDGLDETQKSCFCWKLQFQWSGFHWLPIKARLAHREWFEEWK